MILRIAAGVKSPSTFLPVKVVSSWATALLPAPFSVKAVPMFSGKPGDSGYGEDSSSEHNSGIVE